MITKQKAMDAQDQVFVQELQHIFDVMRSNVLSEGREGSISKFEIAYAALLADDHDARAVIDSRTPE